MQELSNEDSEQSLVHSASTSPDNWSTWWNPSGVVIQKSHTPQNLNTNPTSPGEHFNEVNHLEYQKLDCHVSSNTSTSQFHHEASEAGVYKLHEHFGQRVITQSGQRFRERNQLEYQKLDCHTSSNTSISQFHRAASEAGVYKLHEHLGHRVSTQSVFFRKGGSNPYGKQVEDHMKPVLSLGIPDADPNIDYSQHIPCVSYPSTDPYFGGLNPAYGSLNVIHSPVAGTGFSARVPLPPELADDEPIYVNAKQYNGIMRRRQLRAKLEAQNKLAKERKPYLHESRHLHAMKRTRGAGGRFLTKKELEQQSEPTETINKANDIMLMSVSEGRPSFKSSLRPHGGQGLGDDILNGSLRRLLV